jgi:hypothetical protein
LDIPALPDVVNGVLIMDDEGNSLVRGNGEADGRRILSLGVFWLPEHHGIVLKRTHHPVDVPGRAAFPIFSLQNGPDDGPCSIPFQRDVPPKVVINKVRGVVKLRL